MPEYIFANNTYSYKPKDDPEDRLEVEIGDSKQPDFKPQVKIMRWDNEVNFSARLIESGLATPSLGLQAGKINWSRGDIEVNFYDLPDSEEHKEGGYEFDITLKTKPKTNVIQFTLESKGVSFYYQSPITQEEIDEGSVRPDNIVGSYVIYCTESKTNWSGGKLYKTGKVGHIFRPKIIDNTGNWTWGELNITGGILSVTIPQDFLDKAVYPVRHAAGLTFGYTSVGETELTSRNSTQNKIAGMSSPHTATTGDTVTLYTWYLDATSGGPHTMEMTAYTSVAGVPTSPIASGTTVTAPNDPAWVSSAAVSQSMTNAVVYVVAAGFSTMPSGTVSIFYDEGSAPGRLNSSSTTFTDPFAVLGTDSGRHYSWYATYTASGGSSIKSINGLAKASVKSVNGLAIASVKSWGGLA